MTSKKSLHLILICFCAVTAQWLHAQDSWEWVGDMPVPVAGGQAVILRNTIYILGGYSDSTGAPVQVIQAFNPNAGVRKQWHKIGRMKVPRSHFVARVYNNTVYISGGITGFDQQSVTAMETWNTAEDNRKFDDNAPTNRVSSTGEMWKNIFVLIGGFYNKTLNVLPDYIIGYDVIQRKQIFKISLVSNAVIYNQASALLGDKIYIFGGIRVGISNRIHQLDLRSTKLTRIEPDLPVPRASMQAVVTSNNTVWLIGGYNEKRPALSYVSSLIANDSGYEYQPRPSLNIERKDFMAVYYQGYIYVFGGRNRHNEVLSSVERIQVLPPFVDVVQKSPVIHSFELKPNYPNPFNASTTLEFHVPAQGRVKLIIYDMKGTPVRMLWDRDTPSGNHKIVWDGTDTSGQTVASGVYISKLVTDDSIQIRKMILVK